MVEESSGGAGNGGIDYRLCDRKGVRDRWLDSAAWIFPPRILLEWKALGLLVMLGSYFRCRFSLSMVLDYRFTSGLSYPSKSQPKLQ